MTQEITVLTKRLEDLTSSIARKTHARSEYDKTILETEAAYMKVLESSQTLLQAHECSTVTTCRQRGRYRHSYRDMYTDTETDSDL